VAELLQIDHFGPVFKGPPLEPLVIADPWSEL